MKNKQSISVLLYTAILITVSTIVSAQQPSVDPLTGGLNLGIPIFTLTDGDLKFPVSLSYRTNGINLNSASGLYGQGWNSSAEASISREVRSLPDDFKGNSPDTRKGWLHGDMGTRIKNFTINTDNNDNTCTDEVSNYTFLDGFTREDTEPDVFHVNAPGLSFQFYFDENKAIQVVPLTNVEVTYTSHATNGQILSFTVKDPKGYSYVFDAIESTTQALRTTTGASYYYTRQARLNFGTTTFANSWKLTQINSPVYGQINLTYRDLTHSNDIQNPGGIAFWMGVASDTYEYKSPLTVLDYEGDGTTVIDYDNEFHQKVLESVSSPSHRVDFVAATKSDGTDIIMEIEIYDKRTTTPVLMKEYAFTYTHHAYLKFVGYNIPPSPWDAGYIMVASRSYLTSVKEKIGTSLMPALSFQYVSGKLPESDTPEKDGFGYSKSKSHTQWESLAMGSLTRVQYPAGGYSVVFYEPHEYIEGSSGNTKTGAGIRVKKLVTHDGLNSASDITEEFEYVKTNGQSSGKVAYNPTYEMSVVRLRKDFAYQNSSGQWLHLLYPRYRSIDSLINLGFVTGPVGNYFKLTEKFGSGDHELIGGSTVAYERVVRKLAGAGRTIYEYELPAMEGEVTAVAGEWEAVKTHIARPSNGGSACFERGQIASGYNKFPYPRNPNYSFARGLLKKITDENEAGIKVREEELTYQRVYGGSSIRKIYGITVEELPTYHYTGSAYTSAKMFIYGKYPVYTDVKIELTQKKETLYYSTDLTKKNETIVTYHFESANHKELTKIETTNSDLVKSVTRFKYVNDYVITTPSGTNAANLVKLKTAHRNELIESYTSRISGATEKFVSGALSLFQEISTKIYPYQVYSFNYVDGITSFSPSSISSGTTFSYASNYDLKSTITAFTSTAMPKEQVGKDRIVQATVWSVNGTLPVMNISNAKLNEVAYSNFDYTNEVDFTGWASATKGTGRTGQYSLVMPSTLTISRTITNNASEQYFFSCWIRSTTSAGTLTVKLRNGSTDLVTPIQIAYPVGGGKFYPVPINTTGLPASFTVSVSSSASIELDDVAFYPSHAAVSFNSYTLPFGVEAITNMAGRSAYYQYDEWGRVVTVKDQDSNILNKRNYQIKP